MKPVCTQQNRDVNEQISGLLYGECMSNNFSFSFVPHPDSHVVLRSTTCAEARNKAQTRRARMRCILKGICIVGQGLLLKNATTIKAAWQNIIKSLFRSDTPKIRDVYHRVSQFHFYRNEPVSNRIRVALYKLGHNYQIIYMLKGTLETPNRPVITDLKSNRYIVTYNTRFDYVHGWTQIISSNIANVLFWNFSIRIAALLHQRYFSPGSIG